MITGKSCERESLKERKLCNISQKLFVVLFTLKESLITFIIKGSSKINNFIGLIGLNHLGSTFLFRVLSLSLGFSL